MRNFHFTGNNQITLLQQGAEYFPELAAAIDRAHSEIHLETYIFEYDAIGRKIAEALMRAARRGVSVYLLLDGFGSQDLPREEIQRMLQNGIKVLIFRPEFLFSKPRRHRLRRMHRKLAVIDAQTAFIGGINIIDDRHNPENLTPRFDYAVAIQGPLLAQIHQAAKHLWMVVAWAHFKKRWTHPSALKPSVKPCGNQSAALVIRDNWRHRHDIEHAYLDAINQARNEIIIANAYFLPGRKFSNALKNAARRGVQVTMILPERNDSRIVAAASEGYFRDLLCAGVRLMLFRDGLVHAKIITVDGRMSLSGSANLDRRSFDLNYEVNLFAIDEALTAELDARQQSYVDRSRRLTLAEVEGWSRLRQIRNNLLAIAAPMI